MIKTFAVRDAPVNINLSTVYLFVQLTHLLIDDFLNILLIDSKDTISLLHYLRYHNNIFLSC